MTSRFSVGIVNDDNDVHLRNRPVCTETFGNVCLRDAKLEFDIAAIGKSISFLLICTTPHNSPLKNV